jgi:PilZ domain-containing protein
MADVAWAQPIEGTVHSRKGARFSIRVPVIFRWKDEQGAARQEAGFTRDISTAGIFVYSAIAPPTDAVVELEVLLPISEHGQGTRLRAPGRMLRVEGAGGRAGFAVSSRFALDDAGIQ